MKSVYTINEFRRMARPMLYAHGQKSAILSGSYAREERREANGKRSNIIEAYELQDCPFRDRAL